MVTINIKHKIYWFIGIQLQDFKLTNETVVANAFVFLLAGYETTSTALGFTAWLLAKHNDVQLKLQVEIDEKVSSEVITSMCKKVRVIF